MDGNFSWGIKNIDFFNLSAQALRICCLSWILSLTGVLSTAMLVLWRRIDFQRGIQCAGVEVIVTNFGVLL